MVRVPVQRTVVALVSAALLCLCGETVPSAAPPAAPQADPNDPIDRAIRAVYNQDFAGAGKIVDQHVAANPSDPLGHAARAVTLLVAEYDRLQVLELDFFSDDDTLTDKKRLKPDPAVRARIMAAVAESRRLAGATLGTAPADRRALFAMMMGVGVEMQYASIVEKRYVRGGSLTMESQALCDRALALDPPIYDAYVTLGSIEYVVASLNPVYRLIARLLGLRGSKALAMEHLQLVISKGRYYGPFAKVLMAALHLREGELQQARSLMDELHREFPANAIFAREVARIDAKIARGGR